MSRYIDADKFAKQAYEVAYPIVHDINSHERGLTLMSIAQLLDDQPTADVAEVVRCKDCKHYGCILYSGTQFEYGECFIHEESDYTFKVKPDDFCSFGERREE